MNAQEQQQAMGKIIAKAWADEAYKQRLIDDPADLLNEEGVQVPDGMTVKVVENTPVLFHVILPQKPDGELSLDDLGSAAGGVPVRRGWGVNSELPVETDFARR
ncbi:MAG: NHLP leader peptide family RiPP precursor [Chlorobiaceae bacterium]